MPLESVDRVYLQAASGYIELGLLEEANAELENIRPCSRHVPDVLLARLLIYRGLEKWELMEVVARKLVEWNPNEQAFWIDLACATRRANSLLAARAVLTRAAGLHPRDGRIHFNLARYETQLGNWDRAKEHLTAATNISARFAAMALDDPDINPLWERLGEAGPGDCS